MSFDQQDTYTRDAGDYRRDDQPGETYRREESRPRREGYGRREEFGNREDQGRRDNYGQSNSYGRRDNYERRDNFARRDDYGRRDNYNRRDYQDRRDGGYQQGSFRSKKFFPEDREQLRALVQELGENWDQIGERMNRGADDCRRQWLFWDSQPEWNEDDQRKLIQLCNEGMPIEEMQKQFENRTVDGLQAKMNVLEKRGDIRRTRGYQQDSYQGNPLSERIIMDSKKLVLKAKDENYPEVISLLQGLLDAVQEEKNKAKPQE